MRAKQFLELHEAQQQLFEVDMSPSNLKKLVKNIDALAGIEYEMFVPDLGDDDDPEPDYSDDPDANSIDDIIDFFNDGDRNSRYTIRALREELEEKYAEYKSEQIDDYFNKRAGIDYIEGWIKENLSKEELAEYLNMSFDEEDKEDKEDKEEKENFPTQDDYERAAEKCWREEDEYFDKAKDYYREYDAEELDETDFLRDIGITEMTDVASRVGIDIIWPYWTSGSDGISLEDVAYQIQEATGIRVLVNRESKEAYTLKTDSSVSGVSGYGGIELITPNPPGSVSETLEDMHKILEWAKDYGCMTNRKCGLHMNVSVPNYSVENLDYVKLVLLMGDKYVLDTFKRTTNTYTQSALDIITSRAKNEQQAALMLSKLRENVEEIASKTIHRGNTDKYTSANVKFNRVEFRSPGDNYLEQSEETLTNTLLRFVVALDAACDPNKYRKEYYTKVYNILTDGKTVKYYDPTDPENQKYPTKFTDKKSGSKVLVINEKANSIFSKFLANQISKEDAAEQLLQTRMSRFSKKGIVELTERTVDDNDWMISIDNGLTLVNTIYLKDTPEVNDETKAIIAAQQLYPKVFTKDNAQNTVAQRYKIEIDPELKYYSVSFGFNITEVLAKSEQEAIDIAKIMYATSLEDTDSSRISFKVHLPDEKLTKREMKNILQRQEEKVKEGTEYINAYKLYAIKGSNAYYIPNDDRYIAAKSEAVAAHIAKLMHPDFDDNGINWYIIRVSRQILLPDEITHYKNHQEQIIRNNNQNTLPDMTYQDEISDMHSYRVHNMNGYDYIIAKTPEEAQVLASKIDPVKFPYSESVSVERSYVTLTRDDMIRSLRNQKSRIASAPTMYHIVNTITNEPVPNSRFPIFNDFDAITRLRDFINNRNHNMSREEAENTFAAKPVNSES